MDRLNLRIAISSPSKLDGSFFSFSFKKLYQLCGGSVAWMVSLYPDLSWTKSLVWFYFRSLLVIFGLFPFLVLLLSCARNDKIWWVFLDLSIDVIRKCSRTWSILIIDVITKSSESTIMMLSPSSASEEAAGASRMAARVLWERAFSNPFPWVLFFMQDK